MADAFKITQDTSLPQAIALQSEDEIQGKTYLTVGNSYAAGDYVLASQISPPVLEAIERGEYDSVLEPVSGEEAEQAAIEAERRGRFRTFIPEHEQEAQILSGYGHDVVPRDQELELRAAGADEAQQAQEESKGDGNDERPNLTAPDVPSLTEAANNGEPVVPRDSEPVEDVPSDLQDNIGVLVGDGRVEQVAGEQQPARRQRPKPKAEKQADTAGSGEKKSE